MQEATKKFHAIKKGLVYKKRMIGHLQTNKINKAIQIFDTIDSVDSLRIAKQLAIKSKHNKNSDLGALACAKVGPTLQKTKNNIK